MNRNLKKSDESNVAYVERVIQHKFTLADVATVLVEMGEKADEQAQELFEARLVIKQWTDIHNKRSETIAEVRRKLFEIQ
tara:strand:- start:478 stop:717 length:240 start_codon:yes stop_codon:yes gene_type:complete